MGGHHSAKRWQPEADPQHALATQTPPLPPATPVVPWRVFLRVTSGSSADSLPSLPASFGDCTIAMVRAEANFLARAPEAGGSDRVTRPRSRRFARMATATPPSPCGGRIRQTLRRLARHSAVGPPPPRCGERAKETRPRALLRRGGSNRTMLQHALVSRPRACCTARRPCT